MGRPKGFTHPPAVRQKIRETLRVAMRRPEVLAKMRRPRVDVRRQRVLDDLLILLQHPVHGPVIRSAVQTTPMSGTPSPTPPSSTTQKEPSVNLANAVPVAQQRLWSIYRQQVKGRLARVPTAPISDNPDTLREWAATQHTNQAFTYYLCGPFLTCYTSIDWLPSYERLRSTTTFDEDAPRRDVRGGPRKICLKKK